MPLHSSSMNFWNFPISALYFLLSSPLPSFEYPAEIVIRSSKYSSSASSPSLSTCFSNFNAASSADLSIFGRSNMVSLKKAILVLNVVLSSSVSGVALRQPGHLHVKP